MGRGVTQDITWGPPGPNAYGTSVTAYNPWGPSIRAPRPTFSSATPGAQQGPRGYTSQPSKVLGLEEITHHTSKIFSDKYFTNY